MGLVSTWLNGIGLGHAMPAFKAAGIVTPSALAELELSYYEALGVTEPNDRKKLFYLVQRIRMAVNQSGGAGEIGRKDGDGEGGEEICSLTGAKAGAGRGALLTARGGGADAIRKRRGGAECRTAVSRYDYEEDADESVAASGSDGDEKYQVDEFEHYEPVGEVPETMQMEGRSSGGRWSVSSTDSSVASSLPPPPAEEDEDEVIIRSHVSGRATGREKRRSSRLKINTEKVETRSFPDRSAVSNGRAADATRHVSDVVVESSPNSSPSVDENDNANCIESPKKSAIKKGARVGRTNTSSEPASTRRSTRGRKQTATNGSYSKPTTAPVDDKYEDDSDWDATDQSEKMQHGREDSNLCGKKSDEDKSCATNPLRDQPQRRMSRRLQEQRQKKLAKSGSNAKSDSKNHSFSLPDYSDEESIGSSSCMSRRSVSSISSSKAATNRRQNKRLSAPAARRTSSSSSATATQRRKSSGALPSLARTTRAANAKTRSVKSEQPAELDTSSYSVDSDLDKSLSYYDDEEDSIQDLVLSSPESKQPAQRSITKATPSSRARTRKYESRIQNPTISTRTGKKRLSTIPSNAVAPMSPLLVVSSSQLEKSVTTGTQKKALDKKGPITRGRTRKSVGGARKDRRSSSSSAERNSVSGSDAEKRRKSAPNSRLVRSNSLDLEVHDATHTPKSTAKPSQISKLRQSFGNSRIRSFSASSQGSQQRLGSTRRDMSTAASGGSNAARHTRLKSASPMRSRGRGPSPSPGRSQRRGSSRSPARARGSSHSPVRRRGSSQSPAHGGGRRVLNDSIQSFDSTGHDFSLSSEANLSMASSSGPVFVHGMAEDDSWGAQISRLREDNEAQHKVDPNAQFANEDCFAEEEMRIRVIVRKRPMSKREAASPNEVDTIHPLDYDDYGRILVYQPKTRVDLTKEVETLPFAFDNVFGEHANNVQIYERTVRNLIPGVFEGKWASVFAYGQTGSGKTFTMMGCNMTGLKAGNQGTAMNDSNLGLYYLAAQDVFSLVNEPEFRHLTVGASLFEIYSGKLFDLLNGRKPVKCLENHKGKVCFPGLSEYPVVSASNLMDIIEAGALNRSTGSTSANADSSRSHAVLQLSLRKRVGRKSNIEHGRLTFIDLAGSERGADTSQASRTTRLEGAEINTSLLALKEVIRALATGDSMKHIPFRGSKLTQVLKESFVGKNSRSVMVACVAPNMSNCEHTLNTLRYADRVKERDPETGATAAGVVASPRTNNNRVLNTSSSEISRASTAPVGIQNSDHNTSRSSLYGSFDDEDLPEEEDVAEEKDDCISTKNDVRNASLVDDGVASLYESGSMILDELLGSPGESSEHSSPSIAKEDDNTDTPIEECPSSPESVRSSSSTGKQAACPSEQKEAAESLISTHRTIMTGMLGMVKQEMALVNCTDADRDTIEDYLAELETVQEKQLSMISTLRESLLEYYASRGVSDVEGHRPKHLNHMAPTDIVEELSDDSFEDLRD